jgi:hypothetical protein
MVPFQPPTSFKHASSKIKITGDIGIMTLHHDLFSSRFMLFGDTFFNLEIDQQ